jgi:ketosteroid isomerase-like protein
LWVTAAISRDLVQSYFQACISRDPSRIAPYLDDEVTWSLIGPVDLLPFCGQRHGKSQLIDNIVRVCPAVLRIKSMEIEQILIDGDRAAVFMRLTATHGQTGRTVSYCCAPFLRFRDNKLVEFRGLIDSFDAAEQMLGYPIAAMPLHATRANVFPV